MVKKAQGTKGLVIVYTGGGKGKTTAALGIALRAAGYKKKALIVQFIKGSWETGEINSLRRLSPEIELVRIGKGFVGIIDDKKSFSDHVKAAQEALKVAEKAVVSKKYSVVILDEINYAVKGKLISVQDVLSLIKSKNPRLHLVLTGNFASQKVIEKADLVTEMKEIKHPFSKGIKAQRGIDY
ncbi:cob(I)yrinic acid a,c-diamide adenosyltransferase [Patescibacteria group bacterium]|nr:cob(I)yrinic acid a,c-diamide adenosyltransferase [Patescibacteria group bacterium]MBU1074898.1 cob(I)yrinic acid a,c-diamide adenosyltransferase [Patescibacteria group bacterium]MBU1952068.1 cob(I)yrinic acid a,c-diamide adenosyltransferase [Patescibacteria group bacterium]MBU2229097.1 cob(I)yrinic acid a,c-diamide adenosyltransferase [Patescibacteria group bacterium]MBU2236203.1 cob(I)yrinic acid a,c-diamide adenosyltransferase [Patescibacteria group bacterium]